MRQRLMLGASLVVAGVLIAAPAAHGQIVGDGVGQNIQAPWNTATGGVQGLRAPGNVVARARAAFSVRHGRQIVRARQGPTISDPPAGPGLGTQVRAQTIQTLLDSFNSFLQAIALSVSAGGLNPGTGGDAAVGEALTNLLGSISSPV